MSRQPDDEADGRLPGGLRRDRAWFTPGGQVVWPWEPGHADPPPDARQDGWDEQLPRWAPRQRGQRDRPRTALHAAYEDARPRGGQPLDLHDGRAGEVGPSPRVSVRLPLWLHERLEDEARRLGTTPSVVVRDLLRRHLGDRPPGAPG